MSSQRMNRTIQLTRLGGLLAGIFLALAIPIHAQINPYAGDPLFSLPVLVLDANSKSDPTTAGSGTKAPAGANFTYVPTPALKRQAQADYLNRLKGKNPTAAQVVATALSKVDYGQVYQSLTQDSGLRQNDAADALSSLVILGWMIVNDVQDGQAITVPMARGVRAQFGPRLATNARLTAPGIPAQLGEEMKLQFVIIHSGWQSAMKEGTLPPYRQGIANLFTKQYDLNLTELKLTDQGFVPPRQPVRLSTQPTTESSAPGLEGWFFRAVSGYPAAVSFEPVVLFKNGDYYEVGEQPLEGLNIPQAKQARPAAWGKWQKKGTSYSLTDSKNRSTDYRIGSGNWFPAYSYTKGTLLKKGYERVSGGDYGGGTSALSITKIYFLDATHFSEGLNAGIASPNAAGWKKRTASGTYKLAGNMLELTYEDGKVVRKSFALGATGSPPKPTATMIFIGGDAYTDIN